MKPESNQEAQLHPREIDGVPAGAIRTQLRRIVESETFARSERMRSFLRFTVQQALEGKADRLKEYVIGVEVYRKPETLDPRYDPIVRVEAARLRSKLRDYYETEGRTDPVAIGFRKRSYAPVFEFRRTAPAESAVANRGGSSVAVLPFLDISRDGGQECFCDGLTEEVINALAQVAGVRVVARSSVFQFKGQALDVRRIGQQLGVASVLEGSVRRAGQRVRITAQLNSAQDGYHLWARTFDRTLGNLIGLQEEVSNAIADRFRAQPATMTMAAGRG